MVSQQSANSQGDRKSANGCASPAKPLRVEYRSLESLIPYARNARTHSGAQVAQIAASIREFGWTNPILVDGNNGVIAGHGRLLASRKLGLVEVPVIELAGLSEAAKRAYVLADNKIALNAGWDEAMLALEVGELSALGADLSLVGFSDSELIALAAKQNPGLTDPDEAPEPPQVPITKMGDVWLLGRHRLICGDCTKRETVAKLLGDVRPHLMITDPPYGVSYRPEWRNEVVRSDGSSVAARATGTVLNDDRADWREAWDLFPGEVAYVWHGALHAAAVAESLEASGFAIRSQIIWDKTRLVIGRGDYHWQHEPAWYAVKKGKTGHWAGDRKQTTVWSISHQKSETGHGTQKPVECMKRPIENNSSPGQAVYEPFSGSGTTLIAAEMTGRACYAVELSPAYVDVAVQRWQAFTGEFALNEATREAFPGHSKSAER
ncbi:site-specific DNA-methyltransferase [Bradyrhizobium sp. 159]|uniref:site-specific DNA-methyltransferase n=1 Tax=Bradyrhizobium sp. 159 TaxID=2782632 RepID=UPI001FF79CF3|nr:site-specific DNA-methyltransferase [Bradyrhizobium sp. 159]MCK1616589.1 site-specific DNA-methyltransferase [Bradyrhizobium sp. 159]